MSSSKLCTGQPYVKINGRYIKLNAKGLPKTVKLTSRDINTVYISGDKKEYILMPSNKNPDKMVWKKRTDSKKRKRRKKRVKKKVTKEVSNQKALEKMRRELSILLENVQGIRNKSDQEIELVDMNF